MPSTILTNGKKRKRPEEASLSMKKGKKGQKSTTEGPGKEKTKDKDSTAIILSRPLTSQEGILELEEAITASQRNYNGIVTLLDCLQESNDPKLGITSAVSLCRTFCRMMALGRFTKRKEETEEETTLRRWLRDRYRDYLRELGELVGGREVDNQTTALTLLMRLLKEEGTHMKELGDRIWFPRDLMGRIAEAVLYLEVSDEGMVRDEFVEKYLDKYHDVRFHFLLVTLHLLRNEAHSKPNLHALRSNLLAILLSMRNLPFNEADYELSPFYIIEWTPPEEKKNKKQKPPPTVSATAHRRQFQDIWLEALRLGLTEEETKTVLAAMTQRIVPFFSEPALLMDFITDCYDHGGIMSLLALNGLFELIKAKNLDYPNFYIKLYALFDRNLMHVRYRSRFFRLVDIFLGSSHLQANLIASFIKRMSRLCLTAPPSAVVIVIPFIYNLLKRHPTCTFMIHREHYDRDELRETGMDDPFDNEEPDPVKTGALESSLWEIETLQSHYHPNVATLARVISEQFTKVKYGLEDFLDHSYGSMIDAELSKALKKEPVVEYDVPKKIFTAVEKTEGEGEEGKELVKAPIGGGVLTELWAF